MLWQNVQGVRHSFHCCLLMWHLLNVRPSIWISLFAGISVEVLFVVLIVEVWVALNFVILDV